MTLCGIIYLWAVCSYLFPTEERTATVTKEQDDDDYDEELCWLYD